MLKTRLHHVEPIYTIKFSNSSLTFFQCTRNIYLKNKYALKLPLQSFGLVEMDVRNMHLTCENNVYAVLSLKHKNHIRVVAQSTTIE